jgi:hypothetical protein
MNLRHAVSLLPTPRASPNENRQTHRTPSQAAGRHGLSLAAEVCELLPTPVVGDSRGARQATAPNPRSTSPTLTDLTFSGALLPTPRATDGTKGGPNQRGSKGDLTLPSAAHRIGDATPPPSPAGNTPPDAPPPGQLTLWDA